MKKCKKILAFSVGITFLLLLIGFFPTAENTPASDWIRVTMRDTVNVPIRQLWELSEKVKLEKATSSKKYNSMPAIAKTKAMAGDFSKAGDSRIVRFASGDTLIETILTKQAPGLFYYELTKPSLPMKYAAYRARGEFRYLELDSNKTLTVWTYSFLKRSLIGKFLIQNYIAGTHRQWMSDMLKATKAQVEMDYNSSMK